MTSEIKLVIDSITGDLSKIELRASNEKTQSQAFKVYQVLSDEIQQFSKRTAKIIRLEKALGRLK